MNAVESIAARTQRITSPAMLDEIAREAKAWALPSWHHDRALDHDLAALEREQGGQEIATTWAERPRWRPSPWFEQPVFVGSCK